MEFDQKIVLSDVLKIIIPLSSNNYHNILTAPDIIRILQSPVEYYLNHFLNFLSTNSNAVRLIIENDNSKCDLIEWIPLNISELFDYSDELGTDFLIMPEIFISIIEQIYHIFYYIVKNNSNIDLGNLTNTIKVPKLVNDYTVEEAILNIERSKIILSDVSLDCHHKKNLFNQNNGAKLTNKNKDWEFHFDLNYCYMEIKCRLFNVPKKHDIWIDTINDIGNDMVGRLIMFSARVIRLSDIKVLEYEMKYKCQQCKSIFIIQKDSENYNSITLPRSCPSNDFNEVKSARCCSSKFTLLKKYNRRKDYQEIRVDDSNAPGSSYMSKFVTLVLTRDLVGRPNPGDVVNITGFVKSRLGDKRTAELYIKVNSIDVISSNVSIISNEILNKNQYECFWQLYENDLIAGRNQVIESFAPNLIGIDNAKLAILLSVIGGASIASDIFGTDSRWSKYSKDVSERNVNELDETRSNSHILLLGEPGSGKSQLLKAALDLSNKSVLVSGNNCTSAGLTCSIIREGSETLLSAGALLLANGGICCIDEFELIKNNDESALYETMEQQTISLAKSGAIFSIPCETSIVASANGSTSGRVISSTLALSLLSRFDLIVLFTREDGNEDDIVDSLLGLAEHVDKEKRYMNWGREYIEIVKKRFKPKMTEEAKRLIMSYYVELRLICRSEKGGVGVRALESLIRLSQAHARLLYRDIVEIFDVVSVIWVMEIGLRGHKVKSEVQGTSNFARQGLFSDFENMFCQYDNKISNGITTVEMYIHFYNLLIQRLIIMW